tara:strand:+ start:655 stop:840 length:186 start_codon:yes stop_codon:yes gene_type:complete
MDARGCDVDAGKRLANADGANTVARSMAKARAIGRYLHYAGIVPNASSVANGMRPMLNAVR